MINKVKSSLNTGLMRVKWIATFVAERTKAQTSVARLLYETSKMEGRMDELYREIGKRLMELNEKDAKDVYQDFIIQKSLSEVRNLRETVEDYRNRAKGINDLPE